MRGLPGKIPKTEQKKSLVEPKWGYVIDLIQSEVSLTVPDFIISVFGSSCNSLFYGLILSLLFFLYLFFLALRPSLGNANKLKEKAQRNYNEAEIERIAWTAVHRNGKIWDY